MARTFDPPLKKRFIKIVQGYDVFTVDAFAIRNASQADEEFDNVATHDDYPDLIPGGAIWTAASTWKKEGQFFLANALAKLKAKERGKSENDAFDAGTRADQRLRTEMTGIKYRNGQPHRRVPNRIYVRKYHELSDEQFPVHVWIVEGLWVRCFYKTDYTEGGHGLVYPWCPRNQIWLERSVNPKELPYILAHEYIEMRLMRDEGLEYDRAHEICSELEFDLRKSKTRAGFPGLTRRHVTKAQLGLLVTPEFFEFVIKQYVKSVRRRLRALASDVASKVGIV